MNEAKFPIRFLAVCLSLAMLTIVVGCESSGPSATGVAGSRFVLATEPTSPTSIAAAVELFADDDSDFDDDDADHKGVAQPTPVAMTLVGRIHAGEHSPFSAGEASFLLSELPDPSHGDGSTEHADSCPFCKRRAEKATKALVQFTGEDGKVISTDARELLGVEKGDTVVIQGEGIFDPAVNLLRVTATGLYARDES